MFTITRDGVTVNGARVPCDGFILDATGDTAALTLLGVTVEVEGDAAVTVVAEPDLNTVRTYAAELLRAVTPEELGELVQPLLRSGRVDPYTATLQALIGVLDG